MDENNKQESESPSKKKPKLKLPKPFEWDDSLRVAVEKRAFGHARAGALLARIVGARSHPMLFLFHLSNTGMFGERIWYGFTDFCRSDQQMFEACIEIEDKNLIRFVNEKTIEQAMGLLRERND